MSSNRPRRSRRWIVPVILVVLALGAGLYWWKLRPAAPPQLATTTALRGDLESTVVATGALEAAEMVSVGAQVSGRVESLKVDLGDVVKAGDLIAEIDSTTQSNAVKNAQAALDSVRAQRAAQTATLKQAELSFARQQSMMAQEATSRADYEAAETALDAARAQLKVLDAQIVQSQTALSTAQANLGYTRITAPMDGTVVAVVTKEGQTVNANQSAPTIVKLAQLQTMKVKAEVSEADVIKIKPGQPVYFTILGNPQKRYHASLRAIEPAPESIASESSTSTSSTSTAVYYNALFEVPNPEGELRISMTAEVYIVLAEARNAILIPSAAIERDRQGQASVMVLDAEGRPQRRAVEVGINTSAQAEIINGLAEGDEVVLGEAAAAGSTTSNSSQRRGPPPMF